MFDLSRSASRFPGYAALGLADAPEGASIIAVSRLRRPFLYDRFHSFQPSAPGVGEKPVRLEMVQHAGIRGR